MIAKPSLPFGPVIIVGLGRAGEAALRLLLKHRLDASLTAWDAATSPMMQGKAKLWRRRGVDVSLGGEGAAVIAAAPADAILVKSPGVDFTAPILQAAARRGLPIIDELELGWRAWPDPLIAVTGSNGKSTTCAVLAAILTAAGRHPQIVGNTEFGPPLSDATPGQALICETSSFQLEAAPSFQPEIAVFTNLSLEHLPRHGDMERYGRAKQRLFVHQTQVCGTAVCNIDDPWGRRILAAAQTAGARPVSYGFSPDADLRILSASWGIATSDIVLRLHDGDHALTIAAPGRHNALNYAAAAAAGRAMGLSTTAILDGLRRAAPPPGRWMRLEEGQAFDVIVDYAHTPDGLAQALAAMRAVTQARGTRLRVVFGPVGLPDPEKAAGCAAAIAEAADVFYLTTGSAPRSHRLPRLAELLRVARPLVSVIPVLERSAALARALAEAAPGDVVAALGLGALTRQIVDPRGTARPHSDAACLQRWLRGER